MCVRTHVRAHNIRTACEGDANKHVVVEANQPPRPFMHARGLHAQCPPLSAPCYLPIAQLGSRVLYARHSHLPRVNEKISGNGDLSPKCLLKGEPQCHLAIRGGCHNRPHLCSSHWTTGLLSRCPPARPSTTFTSPCPSWLRAHTVSVAP